MPLPGEIRADDGWRQDEQVGVVHGDFQLSGRYLRQAPACVGVRFGGQFGLLFARGTDPAGEPLRDQLGV